MFWAKKIQEKKKSGKSAEELGAENALQRIPQSPAGKGG